MKSELKALYALAKESGARMFDDQVPMMGAALAYYMMFSIAPLLVIAIGAAGVVFGKDASADIFGTMKDLVGAQGAQAIQSMVNAAAARPHAGAIATSVGLVTLLVGASGVFAQLQQSLNIIWRVAPRPGASWRLLLRQRLLSFGMVAAVGLLLLVSLVVSAAIAAVGAWAGGMLPGMEAMWGAVNFLFSLAIISCLFAAVLKVLPDVRLSWKDVRVGGAVTALLFVFGKEVIGLYIGRSAMASSYGAAGSLIVVLAWVFYSSQILFFGAEFTRALFLRRGRPPEPKAGAVLLRTRRDDAEGFEHRGIERAVAAASLVARHRGDRLRDVEAVHDLAEDRVLAVEVRSGREGDEELGLGTPRPPARHRQKAGLIEARGVRKLVGNGNRGIAVARPGRIPGLDQKSRDHAVKHRAVEERAKDDSARPRVPPRFRPVGERPQMRDRLRRAVRVKPRHDASLRGLEHRVRSRGARASRGEEQRSEGGAPHARFTP
jgi:membrane protein